MTAPDLHAPDEIFVVLDSSGTGDAFSVRQTAIEHARDADPDYMKEFGPITVNRYIHERALAKLQQQHEAERAQILCEPIKCSLCHTEHPSRTDQFASHISAYGGVEAWQMWKDFALGLEEQASEYRTQALGLIDERDAAVAEALERAAQLAITYFYGTLFQWAEAVGRPMPLEQAIRTLKPRSDLVSVPKEALRVLEAARTLAPLLDEGWDEYDTIEEQNTGGKACDELIAATKAWLAATGEKAITA